MKLYTIPLLMMLGCGAAKPTQSDKSKENTETSVNAKANYLDTLHLSASDIVEVPKCIKNKIDSFKLKEAHERPQKVIEYVYKEKKVYYIVMPCCDFFNEVYDDKCNYLGAPTGGFTGNGDGRLPNFMKEVTSEKLIWEAAK